MQMTTHEATAMGTGTITRARGEGATRPVRSQRLLTVAGGTLAALAVWAVAGWVVGLDLRAPAFSGGRTALIGMNLAVAAVVIPFLYRSSASRRDRTVA
jgi:hypothetical protein